MAWPTLVVLFVVGLYVNNKNNNYYYEGWNFNSDNYLFTTNTK